MISTNLIANYITSQNALINFLPNLLSLRKAGYVIIFFGFVFAGFWLSIFSQPGIILIFDNISAFFGPIFMMIRPISALVAGLLSGILTEIIN